ncbi:DUF4136 domain-containing protein [Pontibacter sp. SGAir0037]|uniref:DUF4136 domain-containing protein n=1 Tax=Pontibacter sp. SGAir0037 TaxID=2571030 RepID=UPI0010CD09B4|nr:DUF4136 domain-containing protein [Pontibacter sp. SGAir0037]QCR23856.1 DUF4136 domain-containing protein [Pontibacter sp. SGAir0037]
MTKKNSLFQMLCKKYRPLLLLFTLTTACSPALIVHEDFNPTANFGRYRTYNWLSTDIAGLDYQLDNRELINRSVRAAIQSELLKRGMDTDTDSPDILVAYYVAVGGEQRMDSDNASTMAYGFTGIPNFKDTYSEGTLIIDLVEASTNELVWRGWAEGEVNLDNLQEAQITRAVIKVLAQYPPGTPGR